MTGTLRSPADVAAWYEDRARDHEQHSRDAAKRAATLSDARLAAFVALVVAVAWLATATTWKGAAALAALVALAAFVALVQRHRAARERARHARSLGVLHRRGAARVRRDWAALAPASDAGLAAPAAHPYARDLDVVGGACVLMLLDTTSAYPGRPTMQRWLLAPAPDPATILDRQRAVAELTPDTAFRHELALRAASAAGTRAADVERFVSWAGAPAGGAPIRRSVLWTARLIPVITALLVVLAARGLVPWSLVLAPLLASVLLTIVERGRIDAAFAGAMMRATGLRHHTAMLDLVARSRFTAPLLLALQNRVTADGGAPRQMRRLEQILSLAEVRYSAMLHGTLQLLLVWDIHVVSLLERWQRAAGTRVSDWLAALGDVEALAALGTLAYDNPDWTFPTIHDEARIAAEALGHPLLPPASRVSNDVAVGPPGTLLVVTGSNMSGKSTLLRAIGLNAVLALAGAPVCARRLSLPVLDVWTSARVDDSLAEGVSLFMAELRRLQSIVTAARAAPRIRPLLYLLDEILHGTNTAERQVAARTILHHLLRSGAIGAVTTHDLTLAAEPSLERAARFVHFSERFDDAAGGPRMTFDYTLRPGLATSTNALRLLEMLGLAEKGDRAED